MVRPSLWLLTVSLLLMFTACSGGPKEDASRVENPADGLWQEAEQPAITFRLEQTLGNNEDLLLPPTYRITGPVADAAGNIYFIDDSKGTLFSYDKNGTLRWKTGQTGKGPGDFQDPSGLVIRDDVLLVSNVNGSRIDQFDLQGRLLHSNTIESLDLSFSSVEGIIRDSLLVTSSTLWGRAGSIITLLNINDKMRKHAQFEVNLLPDVDFGGSMSYGVEVRVVDSLIAVGNVRDYALRFYDSKGTKVKTVTRRFNHLMRPGFWESGGNRMIRGYGSLGAPVALSDRYFVTTLSWPTNVDDPDQYLKESNSRGNDVPAVKFRNAIDLYRRDGTLLYSMVQEGSTPPIGHISFVDANGNIYTKTDEPFPQIRRYGYAINSR